MYKQSAATFLFQYTPGMISYTAFAANLLTTAFFGASRVHCLYNSDDARLLRGMKGFDDV